MNVSYSNYRKKIFIESIDISKNIFSCFDCDKVFNVEEIVDHIKENTEKILNNPPKGTWVKRKNDRLIIGSSTQSRDFFALFFIGLFFLFFINYYFFIEITEAIFDNLGSVLFYLIFSAIPFFLLCSAIYSWFGKVEIVICEKPYIFSGVGIIGTKKYVDFNTARRIYSLSFIDSDSEGWKMIRKIIIEDEKNIEISMNFINTERETFLLNILQYKKAKML